MASEPAFVGAGQKGGLECWRIEKLKPVKQATCNGKFHTGDSYIILHTIVDANGKKTWNIHFWLGAETSDDEAGTAAYKTVELDDSLGGGPQQFREVQGNESNTFMSIFKNTGGVEYLPGGVESGFKKVVRDVWDPRLLWCKGARTVRVTPVALSNKSLNKGDVFILDLGLNIYIFNGPGANRAEKSKGCEVASRINSDERGGRAVITFVNDDIQCPAFWGPLGGFINPDSLPEGESDNSVKETKVAATLWRLEGSGFVGVELEDGKLRKEMLTTADIYMVHSSKIYLWIGKQASLAQKREATAHGVKYIKSAGLPASTALERISEGVESNSFKGEFAKWEVIITKQSGIAAKQADADINVRALLANKAKEEMAFDDGSGKCQIWVVQNFKLEEVDPSKYGQFYGGDSYVIQYTYIKNKKPEYVIYFWLGNKSTNDEKGSAALLTKEKDDALGGAATQVRVTQGKEPAHFRQLFKGRMIIHAGGKASGFKNTNAVDTYDTDGVALFHVKGSSELNTVGVQVVESATSLNSEDCFVLITPSHAYAWNGNGSTANEQAVSQNIAAILAEDYNGSGGRYCEAVPEGSESEDFWNALGGRQEYPSMGPGEPAPKDARLFQCSDATGSFKVDEVVDFEQADLSDEDVFILDTYTTLFLWIGSQANKHEKEKATEFAQKFIADANDGRDLDCPIITVHSAQESALFTCQFVGWDAALAESNRFVDPYQSKVDAIAKENATKLAKAAPSTGGAKPAPAAAGAKPAALATGGKPAASAPAPASPRAAPVVNGFYSLEDIKAGKVPNIDAANKELYLDDATFKAKIGVDKAAFAALPKWKRDAKKKELGIF